MKKENGSEPFVVKAMIEAGQLENIAPELKQLSDEFKEKVKSGEARWAGSGFKGKGYLYDASELNDAQKVTRAEKRQVMVEAGLVDPDEEDTDADGVNGGRSDLIGSQKAEQDKKDDSNVAKMSANMLALPGMQEAMMKKAGLVPTAKMDGSCNGNHFVEEIEINDYPREARWKVTQKETTSRLQDEFQTAVTLKGEFFGPNRIPAEDERKLYLHLEATSEQILKNCVHEIHRLLNEETLRAGARRGGTTGWYNVFG